MVTSMRHRADDAAGAARRRSRLRRRSGADDRVEVRLLRRRRRADPDRDPLHRLAPQPVERGDVADQHLHLRRRGRAGRRARAARRAQRGPMAGRLHRAGQRVDGDARRPRRAPAASRRPGRRRRSRWRADRERAEGPGTSAGGGRAPAGRPAPTGGATAVARSVTTLVGRRRPAESRSSGGSATMASTRRSSTTEAGVKSVAQPARSSAASGGTERCRRFEAHGHHSALSAEDGQDGQAGGGRALPVVVAVRVPLDVAAVGDVLDVEVERQLPGLVGPGPVEAQVELVEGRQPRRVGGAVERHVGPAAGVEHRAGHRRARVAGDEAEAASRRPGAREVPGPDHGEDVGLVVVEAALRLAEAVAPEGALVGVGDPAEEAVSGAGLERRLQPEDAARPLVHVGRQGRVVGRRRVADHQVGELLVEPGQLPLEDVAQLLLDAGRRVERRLRLQVRVAHLGGALVRLGRLVEEADARLEDRAGDAPPSGRPGAGRTTRRRSGCTSRRGGRAARSRHRPAPSEARRRRPAPAGRPTS